MSYEHWFDPEEKAKQAAAILKEFCENTKRCQDCIFSGKEAVCELKTLPCDWYLPEGCEIDYDDE